MKQKKKWTKEQYEFNVRKRKMKPVKKEMYKGVQVLISDGFQNGSTPLYPHGAHYQTEWCIATTSDLVDLAQPIFYPHLVDKYGVAASVDNRVKEAMDAAKRFIDACENKQEYQKT
jgi:hypothetical protein